MGLSLFISNDDPREALSAAFEAAELARRAGHRGLEVVNLTNGAEDSLFLGEWSDTRAVIAELGQRELSLEQKANLSCTEGDAGGAHREHGRGLGLSSNYMPTAWLPQRWLPHVPPT